MSISSKKFVVILASAALAAASTATFAKDRYDEGRYDGGRYDDGNFDYAKVIDVQPLTRQVRVSSPVRECWDETRYDDHGYRGDSRHTVGGTLLGAVIGAAIGNQIGHGRGRRAATAGGAVIGAAIGRDQAERRAAQSSQGPSRAYTVQRCETQYREDVEERIDGYRVTYVYNGRRQVTELPYKPSDRIRVRVDVSPAE